MSIGDAADLQRYYDDQDKWERHQASRTEPDDPRPSALVFAIEEGCSLDGLHYREDRWRR